MEKPSLTTLGGPVTGQKRAYSAANSPSADSKEVPHTKVLLLHLNVLLSFKDATTRTLRAAISEVLPAAETPELTDEAIWLAFFKFPALKEILKHLGIRDLTPEENSELHDCYPRVFAQEGWPLIQLAPHAREFLSEAKQRDDISLAVMSNNLGKAAELLDRLGVSDLVEAVIPTTPSGPAQSPQAYHETLIISRALYDLNPFSNKSPGTQICWVKTTPPTPTTPTTPTTQSTQSTMTLKAETESKDSDRNDTENSYHDDKDVKTKEGDSNGIDLVVEGLEELGVQVFGWNWKKEEDGVEKMEDDIEKVEGVEVVKVEDSDDEEGV